MQKHCRWPALFCRAAKTKPFLVMRLTILLLLAAVFQVSAAGHAQLVSLSLSKAPIEIAFSKISSQTGYTFLYNNESIVRASKITVEIRNADLNEALNLVFRGQPLSYSIAGNTIVVKYAPEKIAGAS